LRTLSSYPPTYPTPRNSCSVNLMDGCSCVCVCVCVCCVCVLHTYTLLQCCADRPWCAGGLASERGALACCRQVWCGACWCEAAGRCGMGSCYSGLWVKAGPKYAWAWGCNSRSDGCCVSTMQWAGCQCVQACSRHVSTLRVFVCVCVCECVCGHVCTAGGRADDPARHPGALLGTPSLRSLPLGT
jgi:hypothetical protein